MKHTLFVSAALTALLAVSACSERTEVVEDGPIENASAGSGVGSNPVSNAVQDAASGAVGAASAATLGRTAEGFVTGAANGDLFEIESSRLALQQAQSAELKRYAQKMIDGHTRMSAELKTAAATAEGVTVPAALDERRQGLLDNLRQTPAGGFDAAYRAQQIAGHEESLAFARTYAEAGDNAALKAHAVKGAPMIEAHLNEVRAIMVAGADGSATTSAAAE